MVHVADWIFGAFCRHSVCILTLGIEVWVVRPEIDYSATRKEACLGVDNLILMLVDGCRYRARILLASCFCLILAKFGMSPYSPNMRYLVMLRYMLSVGLYGHSSYSIVSDGYRPVYHAGRCWP